MSVQSIHSTEQCESEKKDRSESYVLPVWQRDAVPVWAGLCGDGKLVAVSARLTSTTLEEVRKVSSRWFPDMKDSTAIRFLVALGLGVMRDVDHLAPDVILDGLRSWDTAEGNAARVAASVCPFVSHAIEEYEEAKNE